MCHANFPVKAVEMTQKAKEVEMKKTEGGWCFLY
jgi:hypothetical protein